MTRDEVKELGFKEIPHYTLANNLVFDLGRDKYLSIGNVGTPNEMLFICQGMGEGDDDLICLHNFDYDGLLQSEKLVALINALK